MKNYFIDQFKQIYGTHPLKHLQNGGWGAG